MQICFIGTGSAFTVGGENYHSNLLVEQDGNRLLLDCGSDARLALHELGLQSSDIESVYISHPHADHAGGLEWLGFTRYFNSQVKKPHLFLHEELSSILWDKVLSHGMGFLDKEEVSLETYFDVHTVTTEFAWHGIHFELVKMYHVKNGDDWMPCHGLFFHYGEHRIFFTADTQFTPDHLMPYYERATVIFHECETTPFKSCVHANFSDLSNLSAEIKAKIWLYHYQPGELPDARQAGFLGFVKKGQRFNFD